MRGLTLIELMVALVLGLLVMGAVIGLYVGNTQGAAFQTAVLRVQENGRFAADMISRTARMAGYNDPVTTVSPGSPPVLGTDGPTGGLLTIANLRAGSDTLSIRYEGGDGIRDCQGVAVPAGSWVTNMYAVEADNELVCAARTTDSVGNVSDRAAAPLAEGVENIQVLYGEDLTGDGTADRYVAAAAVGNWPNVVTIQVAVLVNSIANALPPAFDDDGNLAVEGVCIGCSTFAAVNDLMVRGEFITTINVRN